MADTESAVKERSAQRESTAQKWTILLYQSNDNNLSEEGIYALKEIKKVGTKPEATRDQPDPPTKVNLFAQFDPVGRGNNTRIFHIKGGDPKGKIKDEDVFDTLGEVDMSDPETLRKFLITGIREFKHDTTHFMVILSGHGGGVTEGFLMRDEERRLSEIPSSLPINDLKKEVFDHEELKAALGDRKINILGFDACMMSTVEVCYELHDVQTVELVVGSEGFSLNAGWPYDKLVGGLKSKQDLTPLGLCQLLVKEHAEFYKDYHLGGLSTDLSIIKLNGIADLKQKIEDLAKALTEKFEEEGKDTDFDKDLEDLPPDARLFYKLRGKPFQDAIILAHWAAQSYNGEQSVDLYDFCELLQKRSHSFESSSGSGSIFDYCERVKTAIRNVVDLTCYEGAAFQFSRGISLYFPWSAVNFSPNYRERLRFARDAPQWIRFIDTYVQATQRLPRRPRKFDDKFRSTPPYSRGPEGRILSMRNPPKYFKEHSCG